VQVRVKRRRNVRRRLAILFATSVLAVFGAAACGAGVEEQVEQQVQEATQRIEQEANEVRQ
jgi:hypothetical protein